jgi:hypothetical protein
VFLLVAAIGARVVHAAGDRHQRGGNVCALAFPDQLAVHPRGHVERAIIRLGVAACGAIQISRRVQNLAL